MSNANVAVQGEEFNIKLRKDKTPRVAPVVIDPNIIEKSNETNRSTPIVT